MKLPLAGPYSLRSYAYAHSVAQTINMYPVPLEPGNEREQWALRDIPGLVTKHSASGAVRGMLSSNNIVYIVIGDVVYRLANETTKTAIATLSSSAGTVGMTANLTQLVISDGTNLYVIDKTTYALTVVSSYPGGTRVEFYKQYVLFLYRNSQKFGWTAIGDATSIDPLDFASAEASPDDLVDFEVDHEELILFGKDSSEIWNYVGGDEVFAKNTAAAIGVGAAFGMSAKKVGGTVLWFDKNGSVYKLEGYREVKVSTEAVSEVIKGFISGYALSAGTVWLTFAVEFDSHPMYVIVTPNIHFVYDLETRLWHCWAGWDDTMGFWVQHKALTSVNAFGHTWVGDRNGNVYEMSPSAYTNAGSALVRSRTFPAISRPDGKRMHFGRATLICDTGTSGTVELRYSDKITAINAYGGFRSANLNTVSERWSTARWERCGSGMQRIFELRCSANVPFNPVSFDVDVT